MVLDNLQSKHTVIFFLFTISICRISVAFLSISLRLDTSALSVEAMRKEKGRRGNKIVRHKYVTFHIDVARIGAHGKTDVQIMF